VNADANWQHCFGSLLSPLAYAISAHVQLVSCARPCWIINMVQRKLGLWPSGGKKLIEVTVKPALKLDLIPFNAALESNPSFSVLVVPDYSPTGTDHRSSALKEQDDPN